MCTWIFVKDSVNRVSVVALGWGYEGGAHRLPLLCDLICYVCEEEEDRIQ